MSILEKCTFPEMDENIVLALREAVQFIDTRFSPILGIIAAGSIMRGEGDPYSDIDLYLIFEGDYRQLIHKHFNNVPFQIFANPPQRISQYFEEEPRRLNRGPSTAHMIATGTVIYENDTRIAQFREQAQAVLAQKPRIDEGALQHMRYSVVDMIENMLDLKDRDPDMAMLALCAALPIMLRYYFLKQGRYIPRHKDMMAILRKENPELAQLIHNMLVASGNQRFKVALKVADMTIEARGTFDYEWEKEKLD